MAPERGSHDVGRDLRERDEIEGPLREVWMRHLEAPEIARDLAEEQDVDVDRPRRQVAGALTADGDLHRAQEALERGRIELRADRRSHVEKTRAADAADRRRLVIRRHRIDRGRGTQFLQGL